MLILVFFLAYFSHCNGDQNSNDIVLSNRQNVTGKSARALDELHVIANYTKLLLQNKPTNPEDDKVIDEIIEAVFEKKLPTVSRNPSGRLPYLRELLNWATNNNMTELTQTSNSLRGSPDPVALAFIGNIIPGHKYWLYEQDYMVIRQGCTIASAAHLTRLLTLGGMYNLSDRTFVCPSTVSNPIQIPFLCVVGDGRIQTDTVTCSSKQLIPEIPLSDTDFTYMLKPDVAVKLPTGCQPASNIINRVITPNGVNYDSETSIFRCPGNYPIDAHILIPVICNSHEQPFNIVCINPDRNDSFRGMPLVASAHGNARLVFWVFAICGLVFGMAIGAAIFILFIWRRRKKSNNRALHTVTDNNIVTGKPVNY